MSRFSSLWNWELAETWDGGWGRGTEAPGEPYQWPEKNDELLFSLSGLPEQIPSHQVLLGGGPTRPPGLALDRWDPSATPAVSDRGPGWAAPLSPTC